ncbi:MAG: NAD(P)H-hydrate dehydratase [Spirochaetales bacterium]|nr:NAD(P)H-hydrate dehydratase [Spirochaetales bacterium]
MRRLVSNFEAQAQDTDSIKTYELPGVALMEQAGLLLFQTLLKLWQPLPSNRAVCLVGAGNNGGDALVLARQAFLSKSFQVSVVFLGEPRTAEAQVQARLIKKLGLPSAVWPSLAAESYLEQAQLWIDGIWGAGMIPPLRPEARDLLSQLSRWREKSGAQIAAIDLPSGLGDGEDPERPSWPCRWTLAVANAKQCCYFPQNRSDAGEIFTIPFRFPAPLVKAENTAELLEMDDLADQGGVVPPDAWKGLRGSLGVFAGCSEMTGAAVLACRSAQSAGVGLLRGVFDSGIRERLSGLLPAVITQETGKEVNFRKLDAVLVGPGWGRAENRGQLLQKIFALPLPLVLDADGLRILCQNIRAGAPYERANWILTPHPGELRDLFQSLAARTAQPPEGSFLERLRWLAKTTGAVILAKGSVTWVVSPTGFSGVWDGGEPGLGTAGSGDCLAGFVGAFLARGRTSLQAAQAGVILQGSVGKRLSRERGWFTAEELAQQASIEAARAAILKN